MRRKRDNTPEARARWRKAAAARRKRTDPNIKREYLRERRFRFHRDPQIAGAMPGFAVRPVRYIDRPKLLWMGPDGTLHIEEELSAEELLRRWKEKEHQP